MNTKLLTRAIALAFAPVVASLDAVADSAVGVDTVLGNALNPRGGDPTLDRDPQGKSLIIPKLSRTPTGLLYDWPPAYPEVLPLAGNWNYNFSTEIGGLFKNHGVRSGKFREYADWDDGLLLNSLRFGAEEKGTARYFDFAAGAVGRDDQYYRATFGRYGDFRINAFFNETPHVFNQSARTVFQGAGSGVLTLAPGLVPGNNTSAQVAAALAGASPFELGLSRKRGGLGIDATPTSDLRIYASYAQEKREGTRPFGGALSFNFPAATNGVPNLTGGLAETIEPIDYRTHDVLAGVQWARDRYQVNLSYTGQFFRNHIDTLTWDVPFRVSPVATASVIPRGRFDLYPDNDFHNVKLDAAMAGLPMRGQVTGTLSYSRLSQDDNLVAPTVNSGVVTSSGAGGATVDLTPFNTTAGLSQTSANARIDTLLGQLQGSFAPARDLAVRAKLRHYEENNKTSYTAFNPLTGQFGYPANDGAVFVASPGFNGLFFPGNLALTTIPIRYRSIPYSYRKDNYAVEGDYRLVSRTNVTFGYERENYHRDHRERDETWENRFRLGANSREIPWATVRVSYEYARRLGGAYNPDPYEEFYLSNRAPGIPPHTLAQLRKLDLADRTQNVVNGRVNFIVHDDMDVMLTGKFVDNDYGADYGRQRERNWSVNLDWSWTPVPTASAYAHYGFQQTRIKQANINDNTAAALAGSGDANAGGAVYPLANAWDADSRDRSHTFGLGFRYGFGRMTLESGYSFIYSNYRLGYGFASAGALATPALVGVAGDSMPDMAYRQHLLETSVKVPVRRELAVRLYHRYETARFADWHYDGLPLVVGNELFLGAVPESYSAHVFGVFLQYVPGRKEAPAAGQ